MTYVEQLEKVLVINRRLVGYDLPVRMGLSLGGNKTKHFVYLKLRS